MTLWTAAEAVDATVVAGGHSQGSWSVTGVSIDTRTLEPGDLFVALTAARDGHDFVAQALKAGAGAALVSRIPDDVPADAPLLIVDDVLAGLEALGRAARARCPARVVAVTGSVGKTSTKEMLLRVLSDQGRTHASVASYNNHWGVPLTLARMPRDTEYAIIEIGMNHPGEIAPLARLARPHVALVTTVAAAHLEAFDSIEGIAREKAAILDGLEPDGIAVLNADIDQADILITTAKRLGAQIIGFGRAAQDYTLVDVEVVGDTTNAAARANGMPLEFSIQSAGQHFAMNGLGALASCAALGADLTKAAQSLGSWTPFKGRGARELISLSKGHIDLLDDSYNANPTSMAAALDVLGLATGARRVAFVGDMKELGPDALALHSALANLPAVQQVDVIHCIGPLMKALHAALPAGKRGIWAETSAELAQQVPELLQSGDIVLAKGSLSMQLARIVDAIRKMGQGGPASGA